MDNKYTVKKLVVLRNRSNISVFNSESEELDVVNTFTKTEFKELYENLYNMSLKVWKGLELKEAQDMGSDYFEYYDRKLDNNGYLRLSNKDGKIVVSFERPMIGEDKVYQFNKKKMSAFLYDCRELLK